jgi:hypothetical protein
MPSLDKLQVNVSGTPGVSCTCSTSAHRDMNSMISLMVRGPVICRAQALLFSASATVVERRRLGTAAKTVGARTRMLEPPIQLSVQNNVVAPSPRDDVAAA